MVSFRFRNFLLLAFTVTGVLRAQTPALTQPIPAQSLPVSGAPLNLDLRNYFSLPGVTGQIAQFDTVLGKFNVELFAGDAPLNVANFLSYVNSGAFANTFVHRSVPGFVIQGGGYKAVSSLDSITRLSPVALEYKVANTRGTVAMARSDAANSATSEWFINLVDNTASLRPGGVSVDGYTVIGRVLGTGMTVADAIAALPSINIVGGATNTPFSTVPLRNFNGTSADLSNLVVVNSAVVVPVYPTAASTKAAIEFAVVNLGGGSVVSAALSGSTLAITPLAAGTATLSVRAADTNGNFISGNITVTVGAAASSAPTISVQPASQTILPGGTVAFSVVATGVPTPTYQWMRSSGQPGAGTPALIPGATNPTLVLNGPTGDNAALAGNYSVVVTNSVNAITSAPATLSVTPSNDAGRLTNLSVLTDISAAVPSFTVATVVGGSGTSGTKDLLVRAAGPALGELGFPGTMSDPRFSLFNSNSVSIAANDNWGGGAALANAMASVGAFAFASATSRDAAVNATDLAPGNYSVIVSGVGGSTGNVIAEVYDVTPARALTPSSSRLINVSVLKQIPAGGLLTLGFTIGGSTSKTVLIRVIGPALGLPPFSIGGAMADPALTLFNGNSVAIQSNDDWGASPAIAAAAARVNAFSIGTTPTKDAMLLVTLAPGSYTAQATGNGGTSGLAIVEVYEVP